MITTAHSPISVYFFFFFNDTATTEIYTRPYTLSLHDALPIGAECLRGFQHRDVELRQAGPGEEVEVHVHRIGVHEQNRDGSLQAPGRVLKMQRRLDGARDEPRLAIQKEERDHADEGRQHDWQRDQRA